MEKKLGLSALTALVLSSKSGGAGHGSHILRQTEYASAEH